MDVTAATGVTNYETLNNTIKYSKTGVVRRVIKAMPLKKLTIKEIYVVDSPQTDPNDDTWRAALIDSFCQAGKTAKTFEVLNKKLQNYNDNLVLFVTQANSAASVYQVLQRAANSPEITSHIDASHIYRSSKTPYDGVMGGNYFVADYWHSKNLDNMLNFAKSSHDIWDQIIVVFDEADHGGEHSVKERLNFICNLEKEITNAIIRVIFVTATISNLSKAILRIGNMDFARFDTGVVHEIINNDVVEHYFAQPHPTYVGASWLMTQPNVWKNLVLTPRKSNESKEDYILSQEREICRNVMSLPSSAKELSLIVTSTRTCDHKRLASKLLYHLGYNVVVELNGTNTKNYDVHYLDNAGEPQKWKIPYTIIDARAQNEDLAEYESHNTNGETVQTLIKTKNDYTLSHILQASLFMRTNEEARIKQYAAPEEFTKLDAIAASMKSQRNSRRPAEYPKQPRVALVAGLMCGRGITIQNPQIDFTCTSFCFTHTRDIAQRGAQNTQRLGRACGNIMEAFARPNRQPILIATEGIMRDAIANEHVLMEKTQSIEDGTRVRLRDIVSQADWERIMKNMKEGLKVHKKGRKYDRANTIDGVSIEALMQYMSNDKLVIGKLVQYLYHYALKNNTSILVEDLKDAIEYKKGLDEFMSNIRSASSINSRYGKIWCVSNSKIHMNDKIVETITKNNVDNGKARA